MRAPSPLTLAKTVVAGGVLVLAGVLTWGGSDSGSTSAAPVDLSGHAHSGATSEPQEQPDAEHAVGDDHGAAPDHDDGSDGHRTSPTEAHPGGGHHGGGHYHGTLQVTVELTDEGAVVSREVAPGGWMMLVNRTGVPQTLTSSDGEGLLIEVPVQRLVTVQAPQTAGDYAFTAAPDAALTGTLRIR